MRIRILLAVVVGGVALAVLLLPEERTLAACGTPVVPPAPGAALDDDVLVFDSNRTGNYEIYAMRPDGTHVRQLTDDHRFDAFWGRLSPDGRRILFYRAPAGTHDRDYGKTSLWMVRSDGSGEVELRASGTDGWDVQGHAEWSPDGARLVMFGGERVNPQIHVTGVDAQCPHPVTDRGGQNLDPSWAPDGRTIYFVGCPRFICFSRNYEIYATSQLGDARRVTRDDLRDHDPYVSPDGRQLAWLTQTSRAGPVGAWNIRASRPDGSGLRSVTRDRNINSYPAWSDDGSRIYFHRLEVGRTDHFELFAIRPDGTDLRRLTSSSRSASEYPSP